MIRSLPARRLSVAVLAFAAAACNGTAGEAEQSPQATPETPAAQQVAAAGPVITVYKTPSCGCCRNWVDHVRQAGFQVEVHDTPDVQPIKTQEGVPQHLASCHTAKVGDYVIEGHVPAPLIRRLLEQKPEARGIAVAGMPMGSPGMEGPYSEPYDVVAFAHDGESWVFASVP